MSEKLSKISIDHDKDEMNDLTIVHPDESGVVPTVAGGSIQYDERAQRHMTAATFDRLFEMDPNAVIFELEEAERKAAEPKPALKVLY